jgi:hypothetical protein
VTACRFEIDVVAGATALHTGRPLYRVACETHGLIHPGSTSASHQVNKHLEHPDLVWDVPTPGGGNGQ